MEGNATIFLITYAYEESGGTKTVIEGLVKYYKKRGNKIKRIIVTSPSFRNFKYSVDKENIYLNRNDDFDLHRTYIRLNSLIYKGNPSKIYFFLGHPLCANLSSILPIKYRRKTILYFLDPWFTFKELKQEIQSEVSDFIQTRDNILRNLSNKHASSTFSKTKKLDMLIGEEVNSTEFYNNLKGIIVCSKDMGTFFKKIVKQRTKVLVNPLYFKPKISNPKRYWKRPSYIKLIYTGRVTSSWKGFSIVLEALKLLDGFKLYLYTWDKNEVGIARKLFKHYKLKQDSLISKSNSKTKDFLAHMAGATAVLIPSIAEGFSFTMLESLSVGGITMVGPRYGGPKDVIKDMINGIRFKPGDPEDLAKKIRMIYKLPSKEIVKLRRNAINTVRKYSYEKYIKRIEMFNK